MNIPSPGLPGLRFIRMLLFAAMLAGSVTDSATAAVISSTGKYAWSENAGWTNLNPLHGGLLVNPNYLSGYSWHENLGWLKLGSDAGGPYMNTSASNWGVNRDQSGNLWGYAWSEGWGWVKFNPTGGGVSIDPATGAFSGYAWAENFGWVSFRSQPGASVAYGVGLATYTLNLVFNGNGGGSVTSTNPPFSCNTTCDKTFLDITALTLTADASQYSIFGSWSGCGTVNGAKCDLTLDQNRTATVNFTKDTDHTVRIVGGYDQQYFNNNTGVTTVRGLVIGKGTVTVDRIVIR